jgi:hypothetical protein
LKVEGVAVEAIAGVLGADGEVLGDASPGNVQAGIRMIIKNKTCNLRWRFNIPPRNHVRA